MDDVRGLLLGQQLLHLGGISHVHSPVGQVGVEVGQPVRTARRSHERHAGLLTQQRYQLLAQQAIGTREQDLHFPGGQRCPFAAAYSYL